jgi:hypothetical protein
LGVGRKASNLAPEETQNAKKLNYGMPDGKIIDDQSEYKVIRKKMYIFRHLECADSAPTSKDARNCGTNYANRAADCRPARNKMERARPNKGR